MTNTLRDTLDKYAETYVSAVKLIDEIDVAGLRLQAEQAKLAQEVLAKARRYSEGSWNLPRIYELDGRLHEFENACRRLADELDPPPNDDVVETEPPKAEVKHV